MIPIIYKPTSGDRFPACYAVCGSVMLTTGGNGTSTSGLKNKNEPTLLTFIPQPRFLFQVYPFDYSHTIDTMYTTKKKIPGKPPTMIFV